MGRDKLGTRPGKSAAHASAVMSMEFSVFAANTAKLAERGRDNRTPTQELEVEEDKWSGTASIPDNPAVKIKEVKGIFDALEVRDITNKTIDSYFDLAISHLKAIGLPEKDTDVLRNYAASLMQRQV